MADFGTAPRRIAGVWYTRSGRKLTPAGQRYWEMHYQAGAADGKGHVNRELGRALSTARTAPTRTQRVAAGKKLGAYAKSEQEKLQRQGDAALSLATLGGSDVVRALGHDIGSVVRHPTRSRSVKNIGKSATGKLADEWVVAPVRKAVKDPSVANLAMGGLAAASVLPVGRLGRGAKLAVDAGDAARGAKAVDSALAGRRSLRVGEKVQQLPRARSRITQHLIENPADKLSEKYPSVPLAGAEARVAKHAGRERLFEAHRAEGMMASHVKALPKEGTPEDVAHFWWAQLPKSHRNIEGLHAVRAKQAAELDRVESGAALQGLTERKAKIEDALASAKGRRRFELMDQLEATKLRISDLPHLRNDLRVSISQLDHTIKKAPALDEKVIGAVRAVSGDRRKVLEHAGVLEPERAQERQGLVSRFVGVEPTGEEAFIGHRLDRVRGAKEPPLPASPGVGRPRVPQGVSKENKLVLATQGRLRQSTHVAVQDWRASHQYRHALAAREDLGKMGVSPSKLTNKGVDWRGLVRKGEYQLVNPKGRAIPPEWKTDPLAKLEAAGADEKQIRQAVDELQSKWLADPEKLDEFLNNAAEQGVHWDELRLVPTKTVQRYYRQFTPAVSGKAGRMYDKVVDATMASLIFGRVGYVPKNVAQNMIMAVPHQGALFAANAPRAVQVLRDEQLRHLVGAEVGTGATGALAQDSRLSSKLGRVPGKVANAVSGVADTPFRISAFLHEAAAEGVISKVNPVLTQKDRESLVRLFTDPAQRAKLNDIRARSVEAMADFSRMTPTQRKIARRFLIIPGWLMAGSRYPVHFAATHPVRSAALGYVAAGEPGAPEQLQVNKPITDYFAENVPPWAQGLSAEHWPVVGGPGKVERTLSLSPVNTPIDIASALSGHSYETARGYANPLLNTALNIAGREVEGPYGPYRTSLEQSVTKNLGRLVPTETFVRDMISPPKNPRTYPEDTSRLGRLKREVGILPIRVQGSLTGAKKNQSEAETLIKKLGIGKTLPLAVKKAYARLSERDEAWKDATHGKKAGTRDYYVAKYKADLELAQKWGYLNSSQVAKAHEWIKHAPVDDIRKAHSALSDEGGIYDKEFTPARETQRWLEAQDKYLSDLAHAVKHGELTQAQANRAKTWARKASHGDIDKARVALERRMMSAA